MNNLSEYASLGYRTLVLAKKKISRKEYNEWNKRCQVINSF